MTQDPELSPPAAPVARPFAIDVLVAFGLALGSSSAQGLGRFAYGLLLPSMSSALHWSFATAGLMNTANALGYLIGALLVAPVGRRFHPRRLFLGGLVATGLLMLASASTGNVVVLFALRLATGATGAVAFVLGGVLATRFSQGAPRGRAAVLLGIYFSGGGLGVLLSGLALPPVLHGAPADTAWRWGWVALGVLATASVLLVLPAARRTPVPPPAPDGERFSPGPLAATLVSYGLFGVGYIAYMTFIGAYLESRGASCGEVSAFWSLLGASAIAGGFLWGPMLGRLRGGRALAVLLVVLTAGAGLPLLSTGVVAEFASAVLFGCSFLSVVTAVTTTARNALPPHRWAAAIGALTTVFAAGQCAGPVLAGALSDGGGITTGLLMSVGVLAVAAVVALAQPAPTSP